MERQEFLKKFGIGLMAVCTGCGLAACGGSKSSDPSPATVNPPAKGSGNLFTADLSTELLGIGDVKSASGVILVRIATGNVVNSFTAVQIACTHQGTSINYNTSQGIFICPLHGSEFSKTGGVLLGPAAVALQQYNVSISGTVLTVSA